MGRPKKDPTVAHNFRIKPQTAESLKEIAIECGFKYGDGAAMGDFLDRLAEVDRHLLKVILENKIRDSFEKTKPQKPCRTPTYITWIGMNQRCSDPNNKGWHRYGGRGITVCERWKKFENFYLDMGEKPEGMQIDRIDNDRGYSPENCRWVTAKENCNNTSRSLKVEFEGRLVSIAELAELASVSRETMYTRWRKYGNAQDCLHPPKKIATVSCLTSKCKALIIENVEQSSLYYKGVNDVRQTRPIRKDCRVQL
jgi:hypothetical protein